MSTLRSLKKDKTTSQNLASVALNYTTDYARKFKLQQILVHFSQAVSETITITLDSINGANYDTVLQAVTLVSETDFVYRPQGNADFQAGDNIKIQCTNANGVGIVYVTVKAEEILI